MYMGRFGQITIWGKALSVEPGFTIKLCQLSGIPVTLLWCYVSSSFSLSSSWSVPKKNCEPLQNVPGDLEVIPSAMKTYLTDN